MSIRCGNPIHKTTVHHERVSDVRACYARSSRSPQAPEPDLGGAFLRPEEIDLEEMRRGITESTTRPIPEFLSSPATESQINFIRTLLKERAWENLPLDGTMDIAMDVIDHKPISRREASLLIPALKALSKQAEKAPSAVKAASAEQPWKKLSREVPEGYYCYSVEGKNHFFRVSNRKNFFKIQEQASDELHYVPLRRYEEILSEILAVGLAEAGRRYAAEMSRCFRCGRRLTDNVGNPYFAQGLGPDCGAER